MEADSARDPRGTVTAIRRVGRGRKRLLELDDGRHAIVSDEAIKSTGIRPGSVLDGKAMAELEQVDRGVVAHEAALRLLSTRARSEQEIRTRLALRGLDPETVDTEIERLRSAGLINDSAFADAWVTRRQLNAPRGKLMLRYELLGRGIDPEEAKRATEGLDDHEIALEAARRKARSWTTADQAQYVERLGGFLQRRGFTFEVASEAASLVWEENAETGERPL